MYILILSLLALVIVILAICLSHKVVPPPISHSESTIDIPSIAIGDINSANSNKSLGMYNISVHRVKGGYSGVIRGSTQNCCNKTNSHPAFPASYPYYIRLDEEGSLLELDLIPMDYSKLAGCIKDFRGVHANGIEDPRLFTYGGEQWCIGNCLGSAQQAHPCVNAMCIFKMSHPRETFKILTPPLGINPLQQQKNWSPFEWEGKLLCEYSLQPHLVLEIDCESGSTREHSTSGEMTKSISCLDSLRGGAPPILLREPDLYLGIGHTYPTRASGYMHFFYTFENKPPFKIVAISEIFKLDKRENIQFAAGLSQYENDIYVSYGVNDCFNRIACYSKENVMKLLANRSGVYPAVKTDSVLASDPM